MGCEVVSVQPTPNPNALKFMLDGPIAGQPMSFLYAEQAKDHPLATKLFAVPGVTSLLLLGDFITVNKDPAARWESIQAKVREILKNS